jgi:hypothetical protein
MPNGGGMAHDDWADSWGDLQRERDKTVGLLTWLLDWLERHDGVGGPGENLFSLPNGTMDRICQANRTLDVWWATRKEIEERKHREAAELEEKRRRRDELAESGFAKLTQEEREALGIKVLSHWKKTS